MITKRARTEGINGAKLRSEVPRKHPVYQGVRQQLEGCDNTTRRVSSVTILNRREDIRGRGVAAQQFPKGNGSSTIEIYAPACGSGGDLFSKWEAGRTTAHELDHALYDEQVAHGLYLDGELSREEYEERARSAERKAW